MSSTRADAAGFFLVPAVLSLLNGVGCSVGVPALPDGPAVTADMGAPADLSGSPAVPPDMLVTKVQGCAWRDRFQQLYGHPWSGADVALVTKNGVVTRGIDHLDLMAQKNQVPDIVQVKGSASPVQEIRLLAPGSDQMLASHSGAYVYGLGYAMWLDVNGYGEAGITEATLIRQFSMEMPTYQQMIGLFRVLTRTAEAQVEAGDLADFRTAAAQLLGAIEGGQLTFAMGTGHAADFPQTAQTVNGKRFSFQLSDGLGLDPQLGFQREGSWGPKWQSYSPGGGWSASAPGMQPKCGGCTVDHWAGATYQFCDGPNDQASAQAACISHGGNLATVGDLVTNSFLRGLAPNAGDSWIGLNDLKAQGQYVWETGQPAAYLDWAPGQPDNWMNQERCVQLTDASASTRWNDLNCASSKSYFCQYP